MCGITGFVSTRAAADSANIVRSMTNSMARRGPDAEGFFEWPGAVFGHRRLSIFDLSEAGNQPMLSADRNVGIVFNGAIYNFRDLRRELEQAGHEFRSQCDTEVLLRGYTEWGIDSLVARAQGMFAFAIWDDPKQTLFLVRDRLGVKPLYYAERAGQLAFASTAAALRAAGLTGEIDREAVLEHLEFGFVTDQRVIYFGASKLQAGEILEWRNGKSSRRTYWTLPHADESSRISFSDAADETEKLIREAVRLRLEADVPVGALLSGGVDSGLVCHAMKTLNANITAFTVAAPGDPADESSDAARTARTLGIAHEIVQSSGDEGATPDDIVDAYGEPFGCSSALGMLQVSRAVKPKATVLLTGDGGDDVFLGYPFHKHFFMAQRLARALPDFATPAWRALRPLAGLPALRRPKHFLDYATGGIGAATRVHDGLPYYDRLGIRGERITHGTISQRQIPLTDAPARNILSDWLDYDQRTRFTGEFMTKVDGGAMHYAIEARSPLLDCRLWEFAARLPFALRLNGGVLKAVLREVARRRIGPEVATGRKRGFTIPVGRWLTGRWKNYLDESADNSTLEREGWLRPGGFRVAIADAEKRGAAPNQLWYLLILERWLRRNR